VLPSLLPGGAGLQENRLGSIQEEFRVVLIRCGGPWGQAEDPPVVTTESGEVGLVPGRVD